MISNNKHSTLKGLLRKLGAWSLECLHRHPYKLYHKMHGRPDKYKQKQRGTVRQPHPAIAYDIKRCTGVTDTCLDSECYACSIRDCPYAEPLHYHHDGCPACYRS